MDRYQRVEKPRPDSAAAAADNEIRITTQGRMRSYITYATTLLQEKGADEVVFKAMGRAINKTVMIVELIKRRIVDLHQITAVGSMDITDYWEPLEEGLLPLETTRHVSMISITLSKKELDTSSIGYQNPIPHDQVKPLVDFDNEEGDAPPAGRGRGRGGRGRGRGRGVSGNGEIPVDYVDGGFDNRGGGFDNRGRGYGRGGFQGRGRGHGFQGRGRGGYGGRFDYQQETGDYEEAAPNPVPARGRGRGRGPVRGRGRGFRGNGQNYAGRGAEREQHE